MSKKKENVVINRTDTLEAFDQELDSAMALLDGANQKVSGVLQEIDLSGAEPEGEPASPAQVPAQEEEAGEQAE